MSLLVPHLSFLWSFGRAVLRECGIAGVSSPLLLKFYCNMFMQIAQKT